MMTFTTVLIATDVMGSLPDNPLSFGLRQAAADALPVPFAADLNLTLADAGLPTLPAARVQEPLALTELAGIDLAIVPAPTDTSVIVAAPTSRPAPVRTPRPADADLILDKPDADLVGIWALDFDVGTDYYTIEAQGDGYVVTFIDQAGVDSTPVESQSWDGSVLTFTYLYPVADAVVTIRIETFDAKFAYGTVNIDVPEGNFLSQEAQLYRIP